MITERDRERARIQAEKKAREEEQLAAKKRYMERVYKSMCSDKTMSKADRELIKGLMGIDDKKPTGKSLAETKTAEKESAKAKTSGGESPLTVNSRQKRGSLASSDF